MVKVLFWLYVLLDRFSRSAKCLGLVWFKIWILTFRFLPWFWFWFWLVTSFKISQIHNARKQITNADSVGLTQPKKFLENENEGTLSKKPECLRRKSRDFREKLTFSLRVSEFPQIGSGKKHFFLRLDFSIASLPETL